MKIGQYYSNYVNNIYKTNEERKGKHVEGKTSDKSTVEISTHAKALVKRISESEDSHFSDKVEAIRRSIQEGTYKVDPDRIAGKIMEKIDAERAGSDE